MERLLKFLVKIRLDFIAAAVTVLAALLEWQIPAVVGFVVFVIVVYARVYRQRQELDQWDRYRQIADDLAGFRVETDKLMQSFSGQGETSPATFAEAVDWAGRVHVYLKTNCGDSYAEQFLIVDYARPRAEWRVEKGSRAFTKDEASAMTQISARSNNLNDITSVFQAAARGEGKP